MYHPLTGKPLTGLLYTPLATPVTPAPLLPTSLQKGKQMAVTPLLPTVDSPTATTCSKSYAPVKNKKMNIYANATH